MNLSHLRDIKSICVAWWELMRYNWITFIFNMSSPRTVFWQILGWRKFISFSVKLKKKSRPIIFFLFGERNCAQFSLKQMMYDDIKTRIIMIFDHSNEIELSIVWNRNEWRWSVHEIRINVIKSRWINWIGNEYMNFFCTKANSSFISTLIRKENSAFCLFHSLSSQSKQSIWCE